jgi:peroxiredoxin Q/BCP
MPRLAVFSLLWGVLALTVVVPAAAQEAESELLAVGAVAPDFELPGATRYGLLESPIRLSDYRGETVVLAFFFRVRTPG